VSEQISLGLVPGLPEDDKVTNLCCFFLDMADAKDISPGDEGVILAGNATGLMRFMSIAQQEAA